MAQPIARRITIFAVSIVASFVAGACGGGAPSGPDALRPEYFVLLYVKDHSLPTLAYTVTGLDGASIYSVTILSGTLKSATPGRAVDPRIFNDRSGNGTSGGSSRDSTTAAAAMADIRVFSQNGRIYYDTSTVQVERRGDLVFVKREHPDPTRSVVDTGQFYGDKLMMKVHEWERFGMKAENVVFVYQVTR